MCTVQAMALLGSKEVGTIGVVWCSVTGEGSQNSVSAWCHTDPVPNQHRCASTALSPTGTALPRTGPGAALVLCQDPACSVLIRRLCPPLYSLDLIYATPQLKLGDLGPVFDLGHVSNSTIFLLFTAFL